jgi:hypothetical protein
MSTALVPSEAKPLAATPTQPPVPQYAQGFEGAASAAFPLEAAQLLAAPVNPAEVETKPNGIVYLPGVWYRRQLTRAFGAGAWALLPRGPARTMGEIVIYHGALYILGRFVSEAVGECETRFGMSYASSLEGARTDALTRCCKDLGMATELWDPEWRAAWQAKYCKKEWIKGKDGKDRVNWTKLDKPNGAPAPVTGRNVGPTTAALDATAAKLAAEMKRGAGDPAGQGDAFPTDATNSKVAPKTDLASPSAAASKGGSPRTVRREQSEPKGIQETQTPGAGGQAAVTPKEEAGSQPAATGPVEQEAGTSTATQSTISTGSDTGEAATDGDVKLLRAQVTKLGWAAPKARSWLKATFGESTPTALTKDQAAAALSLLLAAQQDETDTAYGVVYDRLKGQGKVL